MRKPTVIVTTASTVLSTVFSFSFKALPTAGTTTGTRVVFLHSDHNPRTLQPDHTCDACHKIIGAKVNAKLKKDANKALAKMRAAAVPAVVQHSASVPAFKLAVEPPKPPIVVKSKATTGATSAPQPPKRKLEEVSGTQTGEEDSRPFKVTAHKGKEYQTGDALLDALAAQWQGPRANRDASSSTAQAHVNFMGGYTVVLDPSVSSETRVEQLTGACKASSKKIPIGKLVRRFDGASERHSREYWCICAGVATPPSKPPNPPAAAASPVPSQPLDAIPKSGAPLKRSQSTLTTWLAAVRPSTQGGRSGAEEDAPGRGVCGGTIGVDAVTDFSHPLARKGIKGQRVTVAGCTIAPILEDITGVDFNILTGRATLGSITVARRMSWAATRETTRVEDRAYSLMGIFEVHMPTIYGEGHNAFVRLQEEIMRAIPDQSIFAWGRECTLSSLTSRERPSAEDCSYNFGLLAHSPRDFDHSSGVKFERKPRFVSANPLSPAEFVSRIGCKEEEVPPLHSVFTPQGVQIELLCIELKHIPQILPCFFPSLEAAGGPACATCVRLGSAHALALLQCEDKNGALVTLPLYRQPSGAGYLQGLRIGTQIEGCDWHTPFHIVRLTKGALAEALQYLSPIPTKVSLLRYFPPARPTISALPHRTSLFSSMDGEGSVNFCIAPSCEEELRALGFALSPLQSSHSRADNEYYILATSLDSSPGSPFSLSIRLKIVLAKRKMSPSSSLGSSLRGLAPSADAEARFSAASADCRITSDAGTTRNISRSPPLSSSLIDIKTPAQDSTNGSHTSLSFYSDAFGTQDAPLAADFIIHPGAAVENMHLLDPPGLLRIALRHPPNISEVLPHRVLWLSVEISNTPQWARLSVRHPDKLLSATRTGVASRRIDVSEDRRTHREARPRSTSMSAADSGTSSTTDVLPPSRTVGGSQEFRTPLLGAGLIVGLIIVICRYFYS
ncbi:hypothetical protein VTO73DRAFT_2545 [Trametes versicolor]